MKPDHFHNRAQNAQALGCHAEVNDIVITGYTDRIGSDTYNQKLSERRVQ